MDLYGSRYQAVLAEVKEIGSLKDRLCACSLAIKAQVAYAIKTEMAMCPEDVVQRRLSLEYLDCPTKNCRKIIGKVFEE